jgi:hypothetical protein
MTTMDHAAAGDAGRVEVAPFVDLGRVYRDDLCGEGFFDPPARLNGAVRAAPAGPFAVRPDPERPPAARTAGCP